MFPGSLYSAEKMWSKKGSRDGRMGGEWWQKAVPLHFALGTIHLAWCTRTFTLSVHLFELSLHLCSWVVNTTGKMNQVEERKFLAIIIANNWLASHKLASLLEGNDFSNDPNKVMLAQRTPFFCHIKIDWGVSFASVILAISISNVCIIAYQMCRMSKISQLWEHYFGFIRYFTFNNNTISFNWHHQFCQMEAVKSSRFTLVSEFFFANLSE